MLSCLLAVIKGNSGTVSLVTILNSDVDEKNPKYSRFDIPDCTVISSLQSYISRNGQFVLDLVRDKPDDAPIPSIVGDLTVRDLARFLSFQRWKDTTAEQRSEAMQPAHRALSNKREGMTAEELSEAMQLALNALSNKREGMTAEQLSEAMQPALNATRSKDDAKWTAHFDKLVAFKTVNGHMDVQKGPKDRELYDWMYRQRTAKRNSKLSDERIASLESVDFQWETQQEWRANYYKLVAFHIEYDHTIIPEGHELYTWANNQRAAKRDNKLSDVRIKLLDYGLGFVW
jgi:hypothetical protein